MKIAVLIAISLALFTTARANLCTFCMKEYFKTGEPVCGRNGVTYQNNCYAWCNKAKVEHAGACNENNNPCGCPGEYRPVCDFMGETYNNECISRCYGRDNANSDFCFLTNLSENRSNSHFPDIEGVPLELTVEPNERNQTPVINNSEDSKKIKNKFGFDKIDKYNDRWSDDYIGLFDLQAANSGQIN
ncbi:MAG: solute carrier organic anion transporter [Flavobacteriaceae bacterium]|nr:solute carrier organic anion transporter [Flavobacteriaceae bacterium]